MSNHVDTVGGWVRRNPDATWDEICEIEPLAKYYREKGYTHFHDIFLQWKTHDMWIAKGLIMPTVTKLSDIFQSARLAEKSDGYSGFVSALRAKEHGGYFGSVSYKSYIKTNKDGSFFCFGQGAGGKRIHTEVTFSDDAKRQIHEKLGVDVVKQRAGVELVEWETNHVLVLLNCDIHEGDNFRIQRWLAVTHGDDTLTDLMSDADQMTVKSVKHRNAAIHALVNHDTGEINLEDAKRLGVEIRSY